VRILAIRGENLASLTTFDIPLASGPLAGVGLFAITGDTGAGKSTILDAMCLALYGKFPRASAGGREKVADSGGEDIAASDPSHILRRGAASGFAETDFVGIDGQTYRARWAVRRARNKADGRLQSPEHTLARLDGSQTIAARTTATIAAVEERSGFTYDQFCRTVLLAQGEFDRFLLADASQRAELLEKITGTEIYTKISASVFKETSHRKRTLEDRELLCGGIVLLEAPAREVLFAERDEKTAELAAASAACQRIETRLEHAARIAKSRSDFDAANAAVRAAQMASEAAEPSRVQLTLLRAAEPLRVVAIAFEQSKQTAQTTQAKLTQALALRLHAQDIRAQAAASLQTAQDVADATAASIRGFEPEWANAGALDVQITTARTELSAANTAHETATRADSQARQTAIEKDEVLAELNAAMTKAEAALEPCLAHAPLASNLARIDAAAREREALLKRQADHRQTGQRITAEIAAISARIQANNAASERDSALSVQLASQLNLKRSALAAIALPELELHQLALTNLATKLDRVLVIIERRDAALALATQSAATARQAESDSQAASARIYAAQKAHDVSSTSRQELQPLADLADATLTEQANRLRSALVDREPCPVCGSSTHPFTAANSAAAQLANTIKEQRKALDAAIAATSRDLLQAQTALAEATARFESAVAATRDAHADATLAAEHLRTTKPAIVTAASDLGLVSLAQLIASDPDAAEVIAQQSLLASQLEAASERRAAGNALRLEADNLQSKIDIAARHAETERMAAQADRTTVADLTASATGHAALVHEIHSQLTANLRNL
jgi:DNA repair protein SbcC/Rad50